MHARVHAHIYFTYACPIVQTPGGRAAFKYEVMVQDREQLETLLEAVREVPDVSNVIRGKDYCQ